MKKTGQGKTLKLTWDEIGRLCEGMSFAARPFRAATLRISEEYSLGPRGAWMVRVIARGGVFPLDLAQLFGIGRSLVTAELTRLTEAGLIQYRQNPEDGRRLELALTPLGEKVDRRVKEEVGRVVTRRLAAYTREEALLCSRMLRDFRLAEPEVSGPCLKARVVRRRPGAADK